MKIIHFLNELKFSGAEIMYVNAAPIFRQLGCELTVVNTADHLGEYTPYFKQAGYQVIHFPIPASYQKRWKMRHEVIQLIKDYDVVHIHRHDLHCFMAYCAWKAGCKSIYTAHNVFKSHWYSYVLHFMQHWIAEHLFHCLLQTISDSVNKNETEYFHAKTYLVYNWYCSNHFFPGQKGEKAALRTANNIPIDAFVLISVGGCSPIKRHTEIIKALPQIIKRHANTIYLHLGMGVSLEEEQQLAKELCVTNYVRFIGNQTDVRSFLVMSDIYVMPSRFEGISLTTIEAMATGIPCVLYDVPGLRDFNQEHVTSVLIPEDAQLLAEHVCQLYEDQERQSEIIQAAKKLVRKKYDMKTNIKKIVELYRVY